MVKVQTIWIFGEGWGWGGIGEGLHLAVGWSMSSVGQKETIHAVGTSCAEALGWKRAWCVCETVLF